MWLPCLARSFLLSLFPHTKLHNHNPYTHTTTSIVLPNHQAIRSTSLLRYQPSKFPTQRPMQSSTHHAIETNSPHSVPHSRAAFHWYISISTPLIRNVAPPLLASLFFHSTPVQRVRQSQQLLIPRLFLTNYPQYTTHHHITQLLLPEHSSPQTHLQDYPCLYPTIFTMLCLLPLPIQRAVSFPATGSCHLPNQSARMCLLNASTQCPDGALFFVR